MNFRIIDVQRTNDYFQPTQLLNHQFKECNNGFLYYYICNLTKNKSPEEHIAIEL